jgi:prepilin-type N-terminal cleavage/methylation domain-containing protein
MSTSSVNRQKSRGVTLLELLISLTIVVMVTAASARAYTIAINYDHRLRDGRVTQLERESFQDTITNYLHHAWLTTSATNTNSYFIAGAPSQTAAPSGIASGLQSRLQTSSTPGGTTGSSSSSSSGASQGSGTGAYGTPNTLVLTVAGMAPPSSYVASNDDFETLNTNFGPEGGIEEVQFSQDPVGAQGQGKTGFFLRIQTPSDNDPTQGGNEYMVVPNLTQLGFEVFDGNNWQTTWDTRSQTPLPGKLPAAVRVTYRFKGDDVDHIFIVRLPSSSTNYQSVVTTPG